MRFTALAALAALLAAGAAGATPLSDAQQRYRLERAACMDGTSHQDRATCLKEAGAAWQEARRGGLATNAGELQANRLGRCAKLPSADREDCALRMQEGSSSGSAQQGGILRELTRPVPAR